MTTSKHDPHMDPSTAAFILRVVFDDFTKIQGTVQHTFASQVYPFTSVLELIEILLHLFNHYSYPMEVSPIRTWTINNPETVWRQPKPLDSGSSFHFPEGQPIHTFVVRVLARQNVTWQGQIQWIDMQETRYFRSTLELVSLVYQAHQAPL